MKTLDPRLWAIRNPRSVLLSFVCLNLLFLWGNFLTQKGSILGDDAILDEDDPVRQMDRYVAGKVQEGFEGREMIPFIITFSDGIQTIADLQKIWAFTEKVKATFGNRVASPSEIPDYRDTGEQLLDDPHITPALFTDSRFELAAWKARVRRDPTVYGLLVGRNFDWAAIVRFLPPGYDEITEFRRTVEFLEGRKIPWWEWLWKTDISPQDPHVMVGSWCIGRGLIDQGFIVDSIMLVTLGTLLALPVFIAAFGSFANALLGVLCVILPSLLWVRGSIGLLELLGVEVRERVYLVLAYANCVVQGVSFVLHKFAAFQQSFASLREDAWRSAQVVDPLIGTTAAIAILSFGTLWWFQMLTIRELGLLSALGVGYVYFLAVIVLPALHLLCGREKVSQKKEKGTLREIFSAMLERLIAGCTWLVTYFSPRLTAQIAGGVTIFFLFVVTLLIYPGYFLTTSSRPLEFVEGTLVHKTGLFLNQPQNVGFDFLELLAEPADDTYKGLYDPGFLNRVWAYQQDLKQLSGVREISSILNMLHRIAEESYKKSFPMTMEEVDGAFFLLESRLNTALTSQLYFPNGLRISVSHASNESDEWRVLQQQALILARERYSDLRLSTFGKGALHPRMDAYIIYGKPLNLFSSQWVITVCCFLLIRRKNHVWGPIPSSLLLSPWRGGLVMSIPFLFATAIMALLMITLQIPLDLATAAITALAINASIDFAIYFVDAFQEGLAKAEETTAALVFALQTKGKIILQDMLLNALCFAPLLTSHFLPIRRLGWIMGVMLVACAVGTLIIMAALLPSCVVRKEKIA
ncbi:MAG: hypothetical protein ACRERD_28000 [Candidatus Binatia bacterium]